MKERRKEDGRINELLTIVTELKILTTQVHTAVFKDNGIKTEIEQAKGAIGILKFVAGSGGAVALGLLIFEIIKFIK